MFFRRSGHIECQEVSCKQLLLVLNIYIKVCKRNVAILSMTLSYNNPCLGKDRLPEDKHFFNLTTNVHVGGAYPLKKGDL